MKDESPLASRLRPTTLDEVVGQQHIVGKDKLLYRAIKADKLSSIIFYGPPGTGKTTLALSFSHAMGLKVNRVQFTPDVLPADLSGFTIYDKASGTPGFNRLGAGEWIQGRYIYSQEN